MKRNTIVGTLAAIFVLGICLGSNMTGPGACVLCKVEKCPNPCLINLNTGEIGELEVYDKGLASDDEMTLDFQEISSMQTFGTFNHLECAGLDGYRVTGTYNECSLTLPEKLLRIDRKHYCKDCYKELSTVSKEGYILLDTYAPENLGIYSLNIGDEHKVRFFDISVEWDADSQRNKVIVKGNLRAEEDVNGKAVLIDDPTL